MACKGGGKKKGGKKGKGKQKEEINHGFLYRY